MSLSLVQFQRLIQKISPADSGSLPLPLQGLTQSTNSHKARKLFNPDTDPIPIRQIAEPESISVSIGTPQASRPPPPPSNHRDDPPSITSLFVYGLMLSTNYSNPSVMLFLLPHWLSNIFKNSYITHSYTFYKGLLEEPNEMIGSDARPTPIQSLSLKWLLAHPGAQLPNVDTGPGRWQQFLLASETGSGKSIAYLLPLLQNLKEAEFVSKDASLSSQPSLQRPYNPRGLILAPTHELSRQLSGFAKSHLHEIKLRVLCGTSQASEKGTSRRDSTSSEMSSKFSDTSGGPLGEFQVAKSSHPMKKPRMG
ncbi:hypothetical protein BYT27DRAFT_7273461 [Phlegmacium glaucopus]|nr:hypothetical protein BYT27DRAFT_7273461 [Phlegmacium glaucopus]